MKKFGKKIGSFILIIAILLLSVPGVRVLAADSSACGLLPCSVYQGAFNPNGDVNAEISNLVKLVVVFIFGGIILFGIFLIIKAALTIIRSEGDAAKVEEGSNIVRGVFIGIGIIFIGIIGIIIVLAFFGAGGILSNTNITTPGNLNIPLLTN